SYTHSVAFFSSYMKYSAIAQPEKGAMYCIGAGSEADASTTMVYSIAPNSLSFSNTAPTAEPFCPIATYPHNNPSPLRLQIAPAAAHLVPLPQHEVIAEDHGTDVVFLQVQRLPGDLLARLRGGELEHLAGHRRGEPIDAGDAVLHLERRADLAHVDLGEIGRLDFLEEDFFELAGS